MSFEAVVTQVQVALSEAGKKSVPSLTVRLDPPDLGSMQIKVASESSGSVTAHIEVTTPQVRDLLVSRLDDLRRSLAESGFHVDKCSVSLQMQTPQWGHGDQQSDNQNTQHGKTPNLDSAGLVRGSPVSEATSTLAARRGNGLLDCFA